MINNFNYFVVVLKIYHKIDRCLFVSKSFLFFLPFVHSLVISSGGSEICDLVFCLCLVS